MFRLDSSTEASTTGQIFRLVRSRPDQIMLCSHTGFCTASRPAAGLYQINVVVPSVPSNVARFP